MTRSTVVRPTLYFLVLLLLAPGTAASEDFARHRHGPLTPAQVETGLQLLDGGSEEPVKCATWLVHEARQVRDQLSASAKARLDRWVTAKALDQSYESAGGHFVIQYGIAGNDSVPATDGDASGVPDYVEWVAEAMEESWQAEIVDLGHAAVPLEAGERYVVQLVRTSAYGVTFQSPLPGGSYIVINQDFYDFYDRRPGLIGEDPDGKERGAIRVTAAHELKHAIQLVRSGWSEFNYDDGWLELDATFMEDVVYDQVNDYYNYLDNAGSPFTAPTTPLVLASYEDSTWQHFFLERRDYGVILTFWARRDAVRASESPQDSWSVALQQEGIDWIANWGEYQTWNYASGTRARAGFGFEEAARFPTAVTEPVSANLPHTSGLESLRGLAARYHQLENTSGSLRGELRLDFQGASATPWAVRLVLQRNDDVEIFPLGAADTVRASGFDFGDYDRAAVVVGNASTASTFADYSFELSLAESDTNRVVPSSLVLARLGRNPAPSGSSVQYELLVSRPGLLRARIYDMRGRQVREFPSQNGSPGDRLVLDFDGRNDEGRLLGAGVYYLQVEMSGEQRISKIVLLD